MEQSDSLSALFHQHFPTHQRVGDKPSTSTKLALAVCISCYQNRSDQVKNGVKSGSIHTCLNVYLPVTHIISILFSI